MLDSQANTQEAVNNNSEEDCNGMKIHKAVTLLSISATLAPSNPAGSLN